MKSEKSLKLFKSFKNLKNKKRENFLNVLKRSLHNSYNDLTFYIIATSKFYRFYRNRTLSYNRSLCLSR